MTELNEKRKKVGECPECGTPYYAIVYEDKAGNEVNGSLANAECGFCGYGLISGKPPTYENTLIERGGV